MAKGIGRRRQYHRAGGLAGMGCRPLRDRGALSTHAVPGGEPQNKRMQLTKLRAAPVWQAEVPPCAPAGKMDGGTASQLIRSVRWTVAKSR
jgi:hypothetical protein